RGHQRRQLLIGRSRRAAGGGRPRRGRDLAGGWHPTPSTVASLFLSQVPREMSVTGPRAVRSGGPARTPEDSRKPRENGWLVVTYLCHGGRRSMPPGLLHYTAASPPFGCRPARSRIKVAVAGPAVRGRRRAAGRRGTGCRTASAARP